MQQKYVIGVDGGNTKTHYALFNTSGKLLKFIRAGTASHEQLAGGYEGMKHEFGKRLGELLEGTGLGFSDISFSVFGLAGADVKKQYEEIIKRISEMGFINFNVYNDGYLGIKAGAARGYGISSNNGTGTSCTGIDRHGRTVQIGGCAELTGDYAGGLYMTNRMLSIVYSSIYRGGKTTLMKDMLFDLLDIKDEEIFLDEVHAQVLSKKIPGHDLTRLVFNAANQGDREAAGLLEDIGRTLSEAVVGAYRRLDFSEEKEIDIVMAGSIYVKGENPIITDTFMRMTTEALDSKAVFHLLREPPVSGAVLWAIEKLLGSAGRELRCRVLSEFSFQI